MSPGTMIEIVIDRLELSLAVTIATYAWFYIINISSCVAWDVFIWVFAFYEIGKPSYDNWLSFRTATPHKLQLLIFKYVWILVND